MFGGFGLIWLKPQLHPIGAGGHLGRIDFHHAADQQPLRLQGRHVRHAGAPGSGRRTGTLAEPEMHLSPGQPALQIDRHLGLAGQ